MSIREDLNKHIDHIRLYIGVSKATLSLAAHQKISAEEAARWMLIKKFHQSLQAYEIDQFDWRIDLLDNGDSYAMETLWEFLGDPEEEEDGGISRDEAYWYIPHFIDALKSNGIEGYKDVVADCDGPFSPSPLARQAEGDRTEISRDEIALLQEKIRQLEEELSTYQEGSQTPTTSNSGNALAFQHKTNLLLLALAVQNRYLGENFDLQDRDTWPSLKAVIEWVREQDPSLSEATARAIDRVAMPFDRSK